MVHLHLLLSGSNFGYDFADHIFADLLAHALDHIEEYDISFDHESLCTFEYLRDLLRKQRYPSLKK